jgi:hypothetical protein
MEYPYEILNYQSEQQMGMRMIGKRISFSLSAKLLGQLRIQGNR